MLAGDVAACTATPARRVSLAVSGCAIRGSSREAVGVSDGRARMSAAGKRGSRLGRLSVLAPAALSACMDASVLAVPAAGAIVSTVLKELSKAFMLKKWFHGSMSAKEAERLMMEKGKNGSFLVRESQAHPGDFVLSVRVGARVSHVMIKRQDNKYEVGSGERFDELSGLIEHLRTYPMVESSGDVLRLLQPVGAARPRGSDGHRRRRPALSATPQNEPPRLERLSSASSAGSSVGSSGSSGSSGGEEDLDDEFRRLQALDALLGRSCREGDRPENQSKNRYRNVLPFDATRVVLRGGGADYINASYVRPRRSALSLHSSDESLHSVQSLTIGSKEKRAVVPLVSKSLSDDVLKEVKRCIKLDRINGNCEPPPRKNKLYIATQGCLSNTLEDFWRMVWQEDVRIIVMITNEVERGKKKCEKYWPSAGHEERFGDVTVRAVAENCFKDYLVRELLVGEGNTTRTVYQYQFTAWPDHGTPAAADSVLAFVDDVNERLRLVAASQDRPEQNVICVHCSAGVGRTGTFIVLDMVLDEIKASPAALRSCGAEVRAAVRAVRAQRPGMVQNAAQYSFVHRALAAHAARERHPTHKIYSLEA